MEAERLKTKAFFALSAQQPKAKEGEYPILIFNSQPYDIEENVECEFILADQNWEDNIISVIKLADENGNEVESVIPKWGFICPFQDALDVQYGDKSITIGIDDDRFIDEEFKLVLSDDRNQYPSSLVITVRSLL